METSKELVVSGEQEHSLAELGEALGRCFLTKGWCKGHREVLEDINRVFGKIQTERSILPLVILDLNGVLIDRKYGKKLNPEKGISWKVGNFLVYKRPNLMSFLDWLFKSYRVAVWSSAKRWNVEQLVEFIFGERKALLEFVWGQERCIAEPHPDKELRDKKDLYVKDLDDIWSEYPQYDSRNTIIIDDTPEKIRASNQSKIKIHHINAETWICENRDDKYLFSDGPLIEEILRVLK